MQYHKVASLLRERSLFDFPLHRFLKAVSEDVHAQQDDPELFPDILAAIRHWIISSAVPPAESPEGVGRSTRSRHANTVSFVTRIQVLFVTVYRRTHQYDVTLQYANSVVRNTLDIYI